MFDRFELASTLFGHCPKELLETKEGREYGTVTHGTYFSTTCNLERGYNILLPAGYSIEKKYPVMYLLHGIFGNEYSLTDDPELHIKELIGNMIGEDLLEDIIVVFPNMFATCDPEAKPDFNNEAVKPYDNFIHDLYNDLIPHIEGHYSVLSGRENTILAGFSLGGRETIYISHVCPEKFGYVCAIAPAPGLVATTDKFMTHNGMLQENELQYSSTDIRPNVFIICCGSVDSVVGDYPRSYHEIFGKNKTPHIWFSIEGADHNAVAISGGVYNILVMFSQTRRM